MSWFLVNLVSAFLLPPLNLLIVAGAGLFLWHKRPRLARILVTAAFAALWLLSTPYVANSLLRHLEGMPADRTQESADAIVVLSGGQHYMAPEYGGNTVGKETLERLRYAAVLHRKTGKPILVTGGDPQGIDPEALLMKEVLEQEFKVPVRWVEKASANTLENARNSRVLLTDSGIARIYLVTHAWHMPRATLAFERAGFTVVPAPTAWTTQRRTGLLDIIPSAAALLDSRWYLHEMIGMHWYRLQF